MDDAAFKRDRLADAARKLAQRVGVLRAREADRRMRAEWERVSAERNRAAEPGNRADEIDVMTLAVRETPADPRKQTEYLGDMSEYDDHQATSAK